MNLKEKYNQFDKILLTLSRLEPEKNIFMAIDALKIILQKFPKVGLVIVGVGSQKKGLENKIKELELNENVVIWNEYLHAPSAMKTVDIFLLTSDFEGFALTLVESAASGTPIVSTDVGLVGGVLFPEEDILVSQVRDVKTFAEQIERILSDENLREKLVKNALNAVQTRVLQNEQDYLEAYKNSWK